MMEVALSQVFESERHAPLVDRAWNANEVRAELHRIVDDLYAGFTQDGLWPAHPSDRPPGTPPMYMLYLGAAGVIWTLDYLARVGATERKRAFDTTLAEIGPRNRQVITSFGHGSSSLLMGDCGVLITAWRSTNAVELAAELAKAIASNREEKA